jgi:hypothetical protein
MKTVADTPMSASFHVVVVVAAVVAVVVVQQTNLN